MDYETRTTCRSCDDNRLKTVIDLGNQPLANSIVKDKPWVDVERRIPLTLAYCEHCHLVQIKETVKPEILFKDYAYFSSTSPSWIEHCKVIAHKMIKQKNLDHQSLVMEAASNDGHLLRHYKDWGVPVLGIDPAQNIAEEANRNGIKTMAEFFDLAYAKKLAEYGHLADVFHANNVLAHVADLKGFVQGIKTILKPNGVAVLEFPHVGHMIQDLEFDTIYHEHLCYFSLHTVSALMMRHGLYVTEAELLPTHGGSLRVYVEHYTEPKKFTHTMNEIFDTENKMGLNKWDVYSTYQARVNKLGIELWQLLANLKARGKRIAAYGASAKGSTLLNYFGIGSDIIDFVVDKSPHKQGFFMPGKRLPILNPLALRVGPAKPDYVLLLTWNFSKEIIAEQETYVEEGGKFIIPLPVPRVWPTELTYL